MNIQDIIKTRFLKQKSSHEMVHAIIYATVIDTLKQEKNKDISKYLQSVSLRDSMLILKCSSPLIGEEIQHVSGKLEENVIIKLEKIGKIHKSIRIITR